MRIAETKRLFAWDCIEDNPSLGTLREFLASVPDLPTGSYYVGRGRESQWLLTGLGGIRVQFFGVRLNHFVRKEPWR